MLNKTFQTCRPFWHPCKEPRGIRNSTSVSKPLQCPSNVPDEMDSFVGYCNGHRWTWESTHLDSITTHLPLWVTGVAGAIRPTEHAHLWIIGSWSTRSSWRTGHSKQETETSEAKKKKSSVPFMCDSPGFVIRQWSKSFFFELEKSLTNMYSKFMFVWLLQNFSV